MSIVIAGFVKNGVVVPNAALPEGAFVEVHVIRGPIEVPAELQEEMDAWDRASAEALELVDRLRVKGWTMQRGEVWKVAIPIAPGHAQAGERPAVIVQDGSFISRLPTVLIVPFTGSPGATRFPGTVRVQPDGENGLAVPSVALVFQMRVLDQRQCLQRLGTLDAATLDLVFAELDMLTGR